MAEGWNERKARRTNLTGEAARENNLRKDPSAYPSVLVGSFGEIGTDKL